MGNKNNLDSERDIQICDISFFIVIMLEVCHIDIKKRVVSTMTAKRKSLRMNEDLSKAIDQYLEVTGESFNSFAEEAMAEKIEDLIDLKDYSEAAKKDDGSRYSVKDVAKKLSIEL
ncbi:DUF6290 family protein [Companilactobacillus furfuricola]|uniref:DUF6290 family protein n=1 Tax=Companilactobacillus furfuricola TaxID=1462575 RepID=UPI000F7B5A6F|nr:DUF6290 family protein [Companilactobacillus furfuricola]